MKTQTEAMYAPVSDGARTSFHVASAGYYAPVATFVAAPVTVPSVAAAGMPSVSVDDVRALLDAAGALTTRDVAGGLGVSTRAVRPVVMWMLDNGWLKTDEWDRLRLWGPCRDA